VEPELFGPYRLEELIGRGGMGDVYRAYDTVRERIVAVKRLRSEFAADAGFQARFRQECKLAAQLRDAHVVPIHDYGEIGGRLYLDMRYVDGTDLATVLAEGGPLPPQRAADVISEVAGALDAAHAEGLIHRDVKPSNVLLASNRSGAADFAYLVDFGIASAVGARGSSLTVTGATIGTLDYIAPERFQGAPGDPSVDVYSLACVLHEALTGSPPFRGEGLYTMIHAHLHLDPPKPSQQRPDLPPGLDAVVARGMAKDPAARYPSAGALAAGARAALVPDHPAATIAHASPVAPPTVTASAPTSVPSRAPPAPPAFDPLPALRRQRGRPRLAVIALAVLALAVAGAGIALLVLGHPGTAAAQITAEPVQSPGANPFMPPVGHDAPDVAPPPQSSGPVPSDTPGLYGGTLDNATCDPKAMVTFLQNHPDRAAAWAGVLGITTTEIPDYVAGLTPMILRSDTAVTNHGFVDGRATTVNSVLQAGTAVLVDKAGVPRVRCSCGNPLTPAALPPSPTYAGPTWSGFSPSAVTVIQPVNVVINEFVVVNPVNEQITYRRRGTDRDQDRPADATARTIETATTEPGTESASPARPGRAPESVDRASPTPSMRPDSSRLETAEPWSPGPSQGPGSSGPSEGAGSSGPSQGPAAAGPSPGVGPTSVPSSTAAVVTSPQPTHLSSTPVHPSSAPQQAPQQPNSGTTRTSRPARTTTRAATATSPTATAKSPAPASSG
jgi:tRNA A-37 threonylcarbamoyl transferase component Bud32